MASASALTRRLEDPIPNRTPPAVQLPALTTIMLVPADITCASTTERAPRPSATIAITAATPMVKLAAHRTERIRLR